MTMTAISFFSGAGGMNIGMSNAGFDIVMNVENDPYAIETLNANAKYMNNVLDEQALDFNEFELYSGRPKDIDAFFCSPPSPIRTRSPSRIVPFW